MYREGTFFLSSFLSRLSPAPPPQSTLSTYPKSILPLPRDAPTPVPSLCASLWQMGTVCDSRVIGSHPHGVGLSLCVCVCVRVCNLTFCMHTYIWVLFCVWRGKCLPVCVCVCVCVRGSPHVCKFPSYQIVFNIFANVCSAV